MGHDTARNQKANLREIFWLTNLDHKNVVKLKHCFLCLNEMWVVLEFMEGGTLTEAVKTSRFRETEVILFCFCFCFSFVLFLGGVCGSGDVSGHQLHA
jgi:serine/threonine protein kinase